MSSYTPHHPAQKLNELFRAAKYAELIDLCRDNLQRVREAHDHEDDLICAVHDLANILKENGDFDIALGFAGEVLELVLVRSGEFSEVYAVHLHNVGYLHLLLDHLETAQQFFEHARNVVQSLPKTKQDGLRAMSFGLPLLQIKRKDFSAAERMIIETIRQRVHYFGWMHPQHAMALFQLASVYRCQRRFSVAEKVIRKALRIHENTESVDYATYVRYDENLTKCESPKHALMLSFLGTLRNDQNDIDGAHKCHEEALAILRRIRPDGHFEIERVRRQLTELEDENAP